LTCGCIENHWQELAALSFMAVGLGVPIFYIFKRYGLRLLQIKYKLEEKLT